MVDELVKISRKATLMPYFPSPLLKNNFYNSELISEDLKYDWTFFKQELDEMMAAADSDQDGFINYEGESHFHLITHSI